MIVVLEASMNRNDHTITINKITDEAKKSLKVRVISAIVAFLIIVPMLVLSDWVFLGGAIILLAIASYEIVKCAKRTHLIVVTIPTFICCAAIMLWPIFNSIIAREAGTLNGHAFSYFDNLYMSIIVVMGSIFLLFYVIMWDENFTVRDACFIFTIGFLVAFGFQCLIYLRFLPNNIHFFASSGDSSFYNIANTFGSLPLVAYLLLATFSTDIGAYFTGMLFGKKKINPRISPKKTWAGFFGGIFISLIVSSGFALIMAANKLPILPIYQGKGFSLFDINHWYNIVILSSIIPLFATLGDFVFSAIKRYYGIKDFGNIMPGHGGVLDRLDSVVFASIVMAIFIAVGNSVIFGTPLI